MERKVIYKFGKMNHDELSSYVKEHPEEIRPFLKIRTTEVNVLRGRVDIVGEIDKWICLIELKTGSSARTKVKAKKQLLRYTNAVNSYNHIFFQHEPVDFQYMIIRNIYNNLYIDYYKNLDDILHN